METLVNFIGGASLLLNPQNILLILAGMVSGLFFGAIPGMSGTMLVALILPFSYYLSPLQALLLMGAIYVSSTHGGATSAILFNIPGSPENAATAFDGYPLAQKGKAAKTLGLVIVCSGLGGALADLIAIFAAPAIADIAFSFGPPEIFALVVFGLSTVVGVSRSSTTKAVIPALFGMLLATVGAAPSTGTARFTFGWGALLGGIHFIPLLIGFFAVSEVLYRSEEIIGDKYISPSLSAEMPKFLDFISHKWNILRSTIIGLVAGALPGAGSTIASFLSYNEAVRWSKDPDSFGKGNIEGVVAPETANNAATSGAMVPLLVFGIPGGAITAVMLGVFEIHGIDPGPMLFQTQPDLVYAIFAGMLVADFLIFLVGAFEVRAVVHLLKIPYHYLGPVIFVLSIIGAFAIRNNMVDVWAALFGGILGYAMKKYEYSIPALVLGVILGPIAESSFMRAMITFNYQPLRFFTRPIAAGLLIIAFLTLLFPMLKFLKKR